MEILPRGSFISQQDWTLHRRGSQDEARHNEKLKEVVKENLPNIISDGAIITADPTTKKAVKIPMRGLELPRIRYRDSDDSEGIGSGPGDIGDVIGRKPGNGNGGGVGTEPGEEYYEAEFTIEELQRLVFEDLGLPFLKPKNRESILVEETTFDDIRRKRTTSGLDVQRTIMENMVRNARETGTARIGNIQPQDYMVRSWNQQIREQSSAAAILMRDISGSMGQEEIYLSRAFCWWAVSFLRSKYDRVGLAFISHDTQAYESDEEAFFKRGDGGGTLCSSANRMAIDIIEDRFAPADFNIYPLHFSDGDNSPFDNNTCTFLVKQMLAMPISQYAYVQVAKQVPSGLMQAYHDDIDDDRFVNILIKDRSDVLPALQTVFDPKKKGEN